MNLSYFRKTVIQMTIPNRHPEVNWIYFYNVTKDAIVNEQSFNCGASESKRHLGITLSLSVRLSHFWFADNFFTLRDRAFIFGKCVPYDKTFSMVP